MEAQGRTPPQDAELVEKLTVIFFNWWVIEMRDHSEGWFRRQTPEIILADDTPIGWYDPYHYLHYNGGVHPDTIERANGTVEQAFFNAGVSQGVPVEIAEAYVQRFNPLDWIESLRVQQKAVYQAHLKEFNGAS